MRAVVSRKQQPATRTLRKTAVAVAAVFGLPAIVLRPPALPPFSAAPADSFPRALAEPPSLREGGPPQEGSTPRLRQGPDAEVPASSPSALPDRRLSEEDGLLLSEEDGPPSWRCGDSFLSCFGLPLAVGSIVCCCVVVPLWLFSQQQQNQKRNVALQGFLQDAIDMLKEQEDVEGDTTMPHPLALHNSKWKSYYFSSALDATRGKCRQVITVAGNDVSIQGEDTEDGPFTAEGVYDRSGGRLLWREKYSCQPELVTYVEATLSQDGTRLLGQFVANTPMAPGKIEYARQGDPPSRALLRAGVGAPETVEEDWIDQVYEDESDGFEDETFGRSASQIVPADGDDFLRRAATHATLGSVATRFSRASSSASGVRRSDTMRSSASTSPVRRSDTMRSSASLRRSNTSVSVRSDGSEMLRRSNSIRSGGGGVRGLARQATSGLRRNSGFDPDYARKVRAEDVSVAQAREKSVIEADCDVEELSPVTTFLREEELRGAA